MQILEPFRNILQGDVQRLSGIMVLNNLPIPKSVPCLED